MAAPVPSSPAVHGRSLPLHGWIGLGLVLAFWPLNWFLPGLRSHWAFFPLWLGYCLLVQALSLALHGTSLLRRDALTFALLFAVSVPLWWIFEAVNHRTGNWIYRGREAFSDLEFGLWASLSFSTVAPAVLGTAELLGGIPALSRRRPVRPLDLGGRRGALLAAAGAAMLVLVLARPETFYPLVWGFLFCLVEPLNLRRGHRSVGAALREGDWRIVAALGAGALACGFFWEMWNYRSYPKWTYRVPGVELWYVFEMPLLGYLGYIPFALEVHAFVQLALGLLRRDRDTIVLAGEGPSAR